MTDGATGLEERFRWLPVAFVVLFALALAVGLVFHVAAPDGAGAAAALHVGLVLLMASPAVRILVATSERVRRRDVAFLLMVVVIVVELAIVLWRADR